MIHHRLEVPGASLHIAGAAGAAPYGIFFVPGYTDHVGRYGDFFTYMLRQGIAVWAMDTRGHGLSSGQRGYVRRFSQYLDDMMAAFAFARANHPAGHWILAGHSTGGLMVLSALIRRGEGAGLSGAIVVSPLLKIRLAPSAARRWLGRVASLCLPRLSLDAGVSDYANSHDPESERRRRDDPLVFQKVNARWYTEVLAEMDYVRARPEAIRIPLLGLSAGDDRVVDPEAAQAFLADVPSGQSIAYPGMFHEILFETERERVFEDIRRWLSGGVLPG